jgi:dTDP-4-dehydrorhamnose reductase
MSDLPKILVTGSNGQLGKELKDLAPLFPQYEFIFLSREDMPIHHFELVRNTFKAWHPQYCINCAAYTAVDKAESEKELAFQVNAEAPGILASVCQEQQCRFIHISTDYVFDGNGNHPYEVNSPVGPQSVYGASKLEGEKRVTAADPDAIIIRTSWVYSAYGKNFVKTMLKLIKDRTEISVVNDQLGAPTWAADLASVIMKIISSGKWEPGIYHYSHAGLISWYDFAKAIADLTGSSCKVDPITTAQFPTPAKRPAYSALDTSKISKVYGVVTPDWRSQLAIALEKIKKHL